MTVAGAGFSQVVVMETAATAASLYDQPPTSPTTAARQASLPVGCDEGNVLESLPAVQDRRWWGQRV